jgi:hypothetical protein
MKKKLFSCGCSFMAIDTENHGITSFLDLYANEKGFDHVSLGRSGATNFLIRLQIEEAIRRNADFIVIGTTTSDRMEIPIPGKENDIQWPVTIKDIEYRGYRSTSEHNVDTRNPKIISDSINNWTTDFYDFVPHDNFKRKEITPEVIDAMKHYVAYLHSFQLDQMKDYFIIAEGLRKLVALKKEFVFMGGPMFYCDWAFVGDRLWTRPQPWDMPYGLHERAINHNPQQAHDDFVKVLLDMTPHWN